MIDTDKYDNEGIELSDGGTICFPESDGRIQRIDSGGNTMEVRYQTNNEGQEWYVLFDTRKDLLAEVLRLRGLLQEVADDYTDADGITYEIYCEFGIQGDE